MQFRKFGKTDLHISEIGFGAWAIGGGSMIGETAIGWGNADDDESIKAIHKSLDLGVNFFDTADIYGLGHSEDLLGKLIGSRKDIIIATKVGNVSRDDKFTVDYSKKYILDACEKSLGRLRRETIDYYQLHSARVEHLRQGDCIEAMQELHRSGKIRHWGLSLNSFDPAPEAYYLMENKLGEGFQAVLNILNQKAIPLIRDAAAKGYGIIARMPLQFGLLTGKFDKGAKFAENDHRKKRLTPEVLQKTGDALALVWELCSKYGVDKSRLALSFVLSYDEVSTVIPGIRNYRQAEDNMQGLVKLERNDRDQIEKWGMEIFPPLMDLIQRQG